MKVPNAKGGDAPRPAAAKRPLHAASGNVVNHIPTLAHTHTHTFTYTLTHIFMSRNSANVPNCPRHGHPAPPHSHHKRWRWRRWAWQTVCCCCCVSFYIIFCYFAMRSKCGFYVFVYGKIRQMAFTPLSLSFFLSRPLRQGAKGYNYEVYTPFAQAGLPQRLHHFQLVRISFSDFQLAFLPRPISRSPLGFSTSHGLNTFGSPGRSI